jgi:hypothetical protein
MLPGNLLWTIVGFILTILVFSYLVGDNVLFRIIIYAFIGISAGYVTLILFTQVFWPRLILPIINGSFQDQVVGVVALIMSLLLTMKLTPRLAYLGTLPIGYLVGVGAAVAIGGAITGTLIPQFLATVALPSLLPSQAPRLSLWATIFDSVLMILGTITTLIYFQYAAKQSRNGKVHRGLLVEALAWIGKVVAAIHGRADHIHDQLSANDGWMNNAIDNSTHFFSISLRYLPPNHLCLSYRTAGRHLPDWRSGVRAHFDRSTRNDRSEMYFECAT